MNGDEAARDGISVSEKQEKARGRDCFLLGSPIDPSFVREERGSGRDGEKELRDSSRWE